MVWDLWLFWHDNSSFRWVLITDGRWSPSWHLSKFLLFVSQFLLAKWLFHVSSVAYIPWLCLIMFSPIFWGGSASFRIPICTWEMRQDIMKDVFGSGSGSQAGVESTEDSLDWVCLDKEVIESRSDICRNITLMLYVLMYIQVLYMYIILAFCYSIHTHIIWKHVYIYIPIYILWQHKPAWCGEITSSVFPQTITVS